jgi:hypothetical protein
LSLCLTTPQRYVGEWMYRSTYSFPQQLLEVRGQFNAPAPLRLGGLHNRSGHGEQKIFPLTGLKGRTIAKVVSRRVSTAAARFPSQVGSCWICGGQNGIVAGFLQVLQFPLQIVIPPTAHNHHHLSSRAGTISQIVADVPSGLNLTPPHRTQRK